MDMNAPMDAAKRIQELRDRMAEETRITVITEKALESLEQRLASATRVVEAARRYDTLRRDFTAFPEMEDNIARKMIRVEQELHDALAAFDATAKKHEEEGA